MGDEYVMQIFPVSNSRFVYSDPATPVVAKPKGTGLSTHADTVHLSSAAQAQPSGDADHDGDSQ
jgi:hypothetical protein